MPQPPRIAILGAGPAGLTLSSLLTHNLIPYTTYDLRGSLPSTTVPSGSLDLHANSGLLALSACGLISKFEALQNGCCTEELVLSDKNGTERWRDEGHGGRPEIARNELTSLLLSSIPEERVKWSTKIISVSKTTTGWSVTSSSQGKETQEEFDIVIGADGAWSKIRPLLSSTAPHFSGIHCLTLTAPHISSKYPNLEKMIGKGTYSATGEKKAVMVQRGTMDSARIYLMLSSPSSSYLESSGIAALSSSPALLKNKLLEEAEFFASWGSEIKELIAAGCAAEEEVEMRPLNMLPIGFTWRHTPGLTLIGDAAHLMTPFAGEGVNAAMLDALELSKALVNSISAEDEGAIVQGFETFEEEMWIQSKDIAEKTSQGQQMVFADNAPEEFVNFMKSHGPPDEE